MPIITPVAVSPILMVEVSTAAMVVSWGLGERINGDFSRWKAVGDP